MPHSRREFDISTPTARRRLKPKKNSVPYWRFIAAGRYIGYRPHTGAQHFGTWVARLYVGGENYLFSTLGTADDRATADGEAVLSYRQALDKAQAWCDVQERKAKGLAPREPDSYTVAQCMADYLDWYAAHRKALSTTRHVVDAHILPPFGKWQVSSLTVRQIRQWHQALAKSPARLRSAPGAPQQWREIDGPEDERKRKATANRVLTILKAALNFAYSEGRVPSDEAWRRVKPFKGADAAKISYLDEGQATRLLNACEPDFRRLVQAALLTGCRYGELISLQVGTFLPDSRAIHVRESKSGKARHVYLTEEAASFFEALAAGRPALETLLLRADGLAWGGSHQDRRMRTACEVARIEPAVSFHILRHTYASHYLMSGGSLPALAAQLGHADTRMTVRHYGHLADSWRAEEARQYGPRFGQAAAAGGIRRAALKARPLHGGKKSRRHGEIAALGASGRAIRAVESVGSPSEVSSLTVFRDRRHRMRRRGTFRDAQSSGRPEYPAHLGHVSACQGRSREAGGVSRPLIGRRHGLNNPNSGRPIAYKRGGIACDSTPRRRDTR